MVLGMSLATFTMVHVIISVGSANDVGTNVDVIVAASEIRTGVTANGDVVAAAGIALQRLETLPRIIVTGSVSLQGKITGS